MNLKWQQPSSPRFHEKHRTPVSQLVAVFHRDFTPLYLPHAKSPVTVHQNGTAESKFILNTPFLASSFPPSDSLGYSLCRRRPHQPQVYEEMHSCQFPSGTCLMFACLWSTVFKRCKWMNAKENYAMLYEKWLDPALIFFLKKHEKFCYLFFMVTCI